jgi:hypothetical protein
MRRRRAKVRNREIIRRTTASAEMHERIRISKQRLTQLDAEIANVPSHATSVGEQPDVKKNA